MENKEARMEYLENRVKGLTEDVRGYEELVTSYEGIMAAMVKNAGGQIVVAMDDVKEAIEKKKKLMYHYNAEERSYTLMAVEQ